MIFSVLTTYVDFAAVLRMSHSTEPQLLQQHSQAVTVGVSSVVTSTIEYHDAVTVTTAAGGNETAAVSVTDTDTHHDDAASSSFTTTVTTTHPKSCSSIHLSVATECLQRTTPALVLEYPEDAMDHYHEIQKAMLPWAQHQGGHHYHKGPNYNGPWIENYWISHFETTIWDEATKRNDGTTVEPCLSDYFGPFIPLFVPWVDQWVNNGNLYPDGMIETLLSVLRPTVPYVTVSQSDLGMIGWGELDMESIPNVLVLSAGGYGHVPIPLLKQVEPLNHNLAVSDRSIDISYVGSLDHAPDNMRQQLHEHMLASFSSKKKKKKSSSASFHYEHYYGTDWRQVMRKSRFSLVPRGFGRTAYHLMETLQMGLIPVYVYMDDDIPWIPYAELFHDLGYVSNVSSLSDLITGQLQTLSENEIRLRETHIETLRSSHFSYEGVLDQIGRFLTGQTNDLRCQELPPPPSVV
jgi:hypothetical protein